MKPLSNPISKKGLKRYSFHLNVYEVERLRQTNPSGNLAEAVRMAITKFLSDKDNEHSD